MKKGVVLNSLLVVSFILLFCGCLLEPMHEHTFSSDWSSDANYHWHAATCEHTDEVKDKASHKWDSGTITTEATHTADGEMKYTCTICGQTRKEVIPAQTDAHSFSTEWTSDETHHWHVATCEHADVKGSYESHSWDDGEIITNATHTADGEMKYTCTICGQTRKEVIPAQADAHTFSEEWTSDETHHWHVATCEHTSEIDSVGVHEYGQAQAVLQQDGTYLIGYVCMTCGYAKEAESTIGAKGPAGGIVFYDKGEYTEGWRYLEAAPVDMKVVDGNPTVDETVPGYSDGTYSFIFGFYRTTDGGSSLYVNGTKTYNATDCTGTAIGTGKTNTQLLVGAMGNEAYSGGNEKTADYAARLCDILTYTINDITYDDWFLPSKGELELMYENHSVIGGFETRKEYDPYYWSSSEFNANYAWYQDTCHAFLDMDSRHYLSRVRPVRAF